MSRSTDLAWILVLTAACTAGEAGKHPAGKPVAPIRIDVTEALTDGAGRTTEVEISFAQNWPAAPSGLHPFGTVRFLDEHLADKAPGDRAGRLVLEVPIRLE